MALYRSLPSSEERQALDALFSRALRVLDKSRVRRSVVVLPDEAHFRDPFAPGLDGIGRLCARLFAYAGEPDVRLVVRWAELITEHEEPLALGDEHVRRRRQTGAIVTIDDEIEDDGRRALYVDVSLAAAGDEVDHDHVVGELAHAVAWTLTPDDGAEEYDELVEAVAVLLGFGVLRANNASRFRASSHLDGGLIVTQSTHTKSGALAPEAVSYLLALAVRERGLDARPIRAALETNQAAAFDAALAALAAREPTLGIAAAPPALRDVLRPLAANAVLVDDDPDDVSDDGTDEASRDEGAADDLRAHARPTFRVGLSRFGVGLATGGATGAAIAAAVGGGPIGFGAVGLGLVVGFFIGRARRRDICSDPSCGARIPADVENCPGCRRPIGGRIKNADERLAAEEDWLQAERGRSHSKGP
jgi:hypothetical protein